MNWILFILCYVAIGLAGAALGYVFDLRDWIRRRPVQLTFNVVQEKTEKDEDVLVLRRKRFMKRMNDVLRISEIEEAAYNA